MAAKPEEEDWEFVDEVQRKSTLYNCGMMEPFARECRRKGKGKGEGGDGSKGYATDKEGQDDEGHQERLRQIWIGRIEKLEMTTKVLHVRSNRTQVGRVSTGSGWRRGGRCRLPKKWRTTWVRGGWRSRRSFETLEMWWNSRKGKKAPAARDADLSTGTTKVNAMNHVKFVRRVQIREDRRDGFVQSSKRKTCKRLEIDECESDQQV